MRDYWEGLHTMRHGCFLIHTMRHGCFLIHGSFLVYFHARFPNSSVVLDLFPV
jgi:hypothetical protein